jgi:division protein CdvB (Snf7/Vps24/ESCRT-III family)
LVNRFIRRWTEKEGDKTLVSKIKNIGQPSENLKQQISTVAQRIDAQTKTLNNAIGRFETRDVDIFRRVVKALSERDSARANILATELSEIRKVEKMLTHASIGLEGISMRLNTVSEIGDLVTILGPAASMLNTIRSDMSTILPEASQELGNIGNLLSDIVATTNQSDDRLDSIGGRTTLEAEEILKEAEFAAEKKLERQFPEITSENTSKERTPIET